MNKPFLRIVSLFLLFFFSLNLILPSFSFAEEPRRNDSSIAYDQGGATGTSAIQPRDLNAKNRAFAADSVDAANGSYAYQNQDLFIPSRGPALELTRFYNSLDEYEGPFGIGTSHSYNIFLVEVSDEAQTYIIRHNADSSKDKFLKNPDDSYTAPLGCYDSLSKEQEGYLIRDKHGLNYNFDLNGKLTSITDRNQNKITLEYDTKTGLLTKVSDGFNRFITLNYNADGKLETIVDFSARTYSYAYDTSGSGDLISFTTPATEGYPAGLTTTYSYTEHNLETITDARGQTYLTNHYDANDRIYQQDSSGGTFVFSYDTANSRTTITDPKGFVTEWSYDSDGSPISKKEYTSGLRPTDPASYTTTYQYNSNLERTSITYPAGNGIKYTYDEGSLEQRNRGNLLEIRRKSDMTQPDNNLVDLVTTFTYEPRFNFIKTLTDPKGNTTTYYYDYEEATLGDLNGDGITDQSNGNLVKITYPQVGTQTPETKFTYNSYGQVLTVTDPNGNTTKYEYYPNTGYLAKVINAFGSLNLATEMTYDTVGNVLTIKDPKANTSTFEYDSHNNLIKTTAPVPFSYITQNKYDANDNLSQIDRQTNDVGNPWQTTTYTYDPLDRLATIQDELGNATTFSYDANGNRSQIKDAEARATNYAYDERNLLWKVTDALGSVTEYTYDENGNLKEIKDSKTNKTLYSYDNFDRLNETTYADGSKETYAYDANSNLTTKADPKNQTIYYDYDALNRLAEKGLSPQGTVPDSVVTYAYDLGSRLTNVIDTNGTIQYAYDQANRITQTTYPGAKSVSYEYDANSNRTKLVYPDSTYITYEYDQLNRLAAIKDQTGSSIASYQYDALSRRTQLSYANNTQATYQYDAINRLTSLTNTYNPTPNTYSYTHDNVGNRKTMAAPEGNHSYTYDNIYQLKTVDYPAGVAFPDTTFNYDDVGNRASVEGLSPQGTVPYTSNTLNQYSKVASTDYTYDANGNLTSDGNNTYTYDYENRLSEETVPDRGLSLSYTYDPFGRRTEKDVNGATTKFLYDGDQIIAEYDGSGNLTAKYVYGPGIDEPIRMEKGGTSYYYHYDGLGSVTNLTDSSGAAVESYSYDAFGKPSVVSSIGNRFMFTGREYDQETGLYYYRSRYYSPTIGRFLQRDPVGYVMGPNLYTYCGNSPNNWVDPLGLMAAGYTGWGTNPKDPKNAIKQISEKVKKSGIESKTYSYHSWEINKSIGEILKYVDKNGDGKITDKENEMASVELYGHSLGGRAAIEVAQRLNKKGIDIDVLILVDLINGSGEKIPSNVQHLINIRQTVPPLSGQQPIVNSIPYENINMGKMGHAEIINNPSVKKYIENYILATEGLPIDL